MKMQYNFEWDPAKARENIQKHGISFERASEIFLDHSAISIYDDEHSPEKDRWVTLGKDHSEALLVVVHTFRELNDEDFNVRLISARRPTKTEAAAYITR
jgi:hypothetical protein